VDGLLTSIDIGIVTAKGSVHDGRRLRRAGARVGGHARRRGPWALRGTQPAGLARVGASGTSHPATIYRFYAGGRIPSVVRKVALARVKPHKRALTIAHCRTSILSERILHGREMSK